ncbi:MAG: T9SS type A sorting domain-containing protein [Dysgonamonadaceae bacterium]|jgi:photosystem II stability/assembly factor-like uncharacterized protein|nr:T9SS type A sorting domain-containing protein [Dysgonamonadaceae bacterium]
MKKIINSIIVFAFFANVPAQLHADSDGDIYLFSDKDEISFSHNDTDSVNIQSNISWTISYVADWISVSPSSGYGDAKIIVSVSANRSLVSRSSEIIISGEAVEDRVIQVSQEPGYSSGWEYVRTIEYGEGRKSNDLMNKVCAQGESNVYIVGEQGFIAKSADNALTWEKQHFPSQTGLNDIIFCNDELGFIVGNNGTILKTNDAGANWIQLNSGTTQNINAIAATNENNIWAVGNGGLIIHSTDAGDTWITENDTNNRNLYDISFHNETGYIVGDGNQVLIKNEEGIYPVWQTQDAYTNPDESDKITTLSITGNTVYALVKREAYYNSNMIVYKSDNNDWAVFNLESETVHFTDAIIHIFFQSDDVAYVAYPAPIPTGASYYSGGNPVLAKTIDGGQTWYEQYLPRLLYHQEYIAHYSDKVDFSFSENNEYGYLVSGGYLLRTPYTGDFYVELSDIKANNPDLILKQQNNELQISSFLSKTIVRIELVSVAGNRLLQENRQAKDINVDVSALPKGVYLIHAFFADKTSAAVKWIKQ